MRYVTLLLLVVTQLFGIKAQTADSLNTDKPLIGRFARSGIGQATIVSVPLAITGIAVRNEDKHFINNVNGYMPEHNKHEYYLQYVPAVTLLSMKLAGVKGTSTWSEMLTADAFAVMLMGGAVEGFKHILDAERPDGTDNHAFPSGHTATAFMTATMLHHEYGARYPWLSVLGYGTATATGVMRIAQNRHSVSDVIAGASVGIMATELGYLVSDLIYHKSILSDIDIIRDSGSFKPSFIGYNASFSLPTAEFRVYDDLMLKMSSGYAVGLEGAWFINRHMGVGAQGAYTEARFYANGIAQPKTLNYINGTGNVYMALPLSKFFTAGCKAKAGLSHYNKTETVDNALNSLCDIPSNGGITYGFGLWLMMRAQQSLSYKLYAEYDTLPAVVKSADRPKTVSIGLQMGYTF